MKDETNLDRFDRVFGHVFGGLQPPEEGATMGIPEEWLRKISEHVLSEEEKALVEALGGWDKLMEALKKRLEEQKGRHQGGSKWIGTAGTSPFGAYGYNPEGVRIGQEENRHNRAVKVWDKREFRNLDAEVELGTRNIKVALRRLRRSARQGAATELDLPATIRSTAKKGWLDLEMVPERHNAVKVLLFLDVGGSMDPHVEVCEELFSAARSEFSTWSTSTSITAFTSGSGATTAAATLSRRLLGTCCTPTARLQGDLRRRRLDEPSRNRYPGRLGRALERGGGYHLAAAGAQRLRQGGVAEPRAGGLVELHSLDPDDPQIFGDRMFPLTLDGLDRAMRCLSR